MTSQIDTQIDIELEYKCTVLKFNGVPVTGTVASGPATYWEPAWCDAHVFVGLTVTEVTEWITEQFEDDDQPVPTWAITDAQDILDQLKDRIEASV